MRNGGIERTPKCGKYAKVGKERRREKERETETSGEQFSCGAQAAALTLSVITKSHTQLQG